MNYFENMAEVLNSLFHISMQAEPHLWEIHTTSDIFNERSRVHVLQVQLHLLSGGEVLSLHIQFSNLTWLSSGMY